MKKSGILAVCLLLLCFWTASVSADNMVTAEIEMMGEGIRWGTVAEDGLVKVFKYVNDEEIIVYQGLLSGYDNGAWTGFDFSQAPMAVIFDWDTHETLYMIPIAPAENSISLWNVEPELMISAQYYVNNHMTGGDGFELQNGDTVTAEYVIQNNSAKVQEVKLIVCLYAGDNTLLDMNIVSDTISANSSRTVRNSLEAGTDNCYVKVFLWDNFRSLVPLYSTAQIGDVPVSERIATATLACTAGKEYNLILQAANMPANTDGLYTVRYDPEKLQVADLCCLTYPKELEPGMIESAGIQIVSFDPQNGSITFSNPNQEDRAVSKVLNGVRFSCLVSDVQTVITVE